jgi:CDP-glucose 4,6-dehydratase
VASDARPVSWIADHLVSSWGDDATWRLDDGAHPSEAEFLRLDASKARALGWQPILPLANTLDWIVEWYRAWQSDADVSAITRTQLTRYSTLVTD